MLSKKLVFVSLTTLGLLTAAARVCPAQTVYDPGNISSILEDNSLRDATTRYMSVYSFFFPEEATRLGFTSTRNTLNDRSPETDAQALQALEAVRTALQEITPQRLSPSRVADYNLLSNALDNAVWMLEQNRLARDPLYYTQALDAVYDLLLFTYTDPRQEFRDYLGRVSALPKISRQARQNLTDVSPEASRAAMEKAYYAYLSFDEISKHLANGVNLTAETSDPAELDKIGREAKNAIRDMFNLFKSLSQQEEILQDFRLGPSNYREWLQLHYHVTDKPELLAKQLNTRLETAQKNLWRALQPFELSAELEEVTVVEDLNEPPQNEAYAQPEEKSGKAKKPSKKQAPVYVPPTANQFYALAQQLRATLTTKDFLDNFTKQVSSFGAKLVRQKVLPVSMSFPTKELPAYFAYQNLYVDIPALRTFFLRVPSGNKLAQEQALNRDFNEPACKMLISHQLVPGHYYQTYSMGNSIRRLLGAPTLANGWEEYALQLAQTQGYFVTDEEQLFVAWHQYKRALLAVVDQRLHTHSYTYDTALNFLTQEHGFSQEEAAQLINEVIVRPGEAVSFVAGAKLWEQAAATYQKKYKDIGRVNTLLLQTGNVLPQDLKSELKRLYKATK